MASIQFITDEHAKKQAVILPMDEYERLLAAADMMKIIKLFPIQRDQMTMKLFLMKSFLSW